MHFPIQVGHHKSGSHLLYSTFKLLRHIRGGLITPQGIPSADTVPEQTLANLIVIKCYRRGGQLSNQLPGFQFEPIIPPRLSSGDYYSSLSLMCGLSTEGWWFKAIQAHELVLFEGIKMFSHYFSHPLSMRIRSAATALENNIFPFLMCTTRDERARATQTACQPPDRPIDVTPEYSVGGR